MDYDGDGVVDWVTPVFGDVATPASVVWCKGSLLVAQNHFLWRLPNVDAYALSKQAREL